MSRHDRSLLSTAAVVVVVVTAALLVWQERRPSQRSVDESGARAVERAYREQRSDVWVEVDGRVTRLLADDNRGSRHQRFIIELAGGHTLLVSHNIDLAPKVPLGAGDRVAVRGEYEWNERGGVLHWTHHDPSGRRPGGWVRLRGQTYR